MQDCSQGFEQEWRFESRCRRAMATKEATQKGVAEAAGFCRTPPNRSRTAAKSIRKPFGMF